MQQVFDQTQVLLFRLDIGVQFSGPIFGHLARRSLAHAKPFFTPGQGPRIAAAACPAGTGKSQEQQIGILSLSEKTTRRLARAGVLSLIIVRDKGGMPATAKYGRE